MDNIYLEGTFLAGKRNKLEGTFLAGKRNKTELEGTFLAGKRNLKVPPSQVEGTVHYISFGYSGSYAKIFSHVFRTCISVLLYHLSEKHAYRAKLVDNPQCDFCTETDEQETALHILTNCIAFSRLRQSTFGQSTFGYANLIYNTNIKKTIKNIAIFFRKTKAFAKKRETLPSPRH